MAGLIQMMEELREGVGQTNKLLFEYMETPMVIRAAAALDDILMKALRKKMRPEMSKNLVEKLFEGYGPIATFAARIDLAYAFDIISEDDRAEFNKIKAIRNEFSHSTEGLTLAAPSLQTHFKELRKPASFEGTDLEVFLECMGILERKLERYVNPEKGKPPEEG
jgi:DNA-binding MltR family transcriptional regulator